MSAHPRPSATEQPASAVVRALRAVPDPATEPPVREAPRGLVLHVLLSEESASVSGTVAPPSAVPSSAVPASSAPSTASVDSDAESTASGTTGSEPRAAALAAVSPVSGSGAGASSVGSGIADRR